MDILKDYAMSFLGTPYYYGGNNRLTGMDCSGYVLEVLKSAIPDIDVDMSSQMIHHWLERRSGTRFNTWGCGSIVFFGASTTKISHVAFCIDQYRMLEAGGGNRDTKSRAEAEARGAMVRMRTIADRKDRVAMLRPSYASIGLIE